MKRLFCATALLASMGMTTSAFAVDCRVNGGPWLTGNPNLFVPVTVRLTADRTRIMLEGARLECRFSIGNQSPSWWTDYWDTTNFAGNSWTPGPKFRGERTGLRINGAFYDTPIPIGIRAATIPDNLRAYPIDVTSYILMRNNPSTPISIRVGDNLGLLRMASTNNYDPTGAILSVSYTAANNFEVSPSTCTINNNNPININFGNVHQQLIGTDPLTTPVTSNFRLTYACPEGGINTPITITYRGAGSSFDSRLLMMTNPNVGTALVRAGGVVPVNGLFHTRITNSVGADDVTFSLVRRAGVIPVAGPVSGSGVLVMGVP